MLLNKVGLSNEAESNLDSLRELDMGDETRLAFVIFFSEDIRNIFSL